MASNYTQDKRISKFTSPLGGDELVILSFRGREAMNEPFEYEVEVINTKKAILQFNDAIGKHCTLTMNTVGGGKRHFDGILTESQWLESRTEGNIYRLVLRPWLWLLSKRTNSLIFHELTAPEIISEIFGAHGGLAKYRQSLSRNYPQIEYVAQYRESDMDFVCRLMEQHGISYHFVHEEGKHTLVMGDGASAYSPVPSSDRPFIAVDARHRRETEHLSLWRPERRFTTGKITLRDYDFKRPSANLDAEQSGDAAYEHGSLESYEYPAKYVERSDGSDYAQVHLDRERAKDNRFITEGDCASFYPGALFNLTGHPDDAQNEQYLILRCAHQFTGESYRSGSGDAKPYEGHYECMRADKPYAPPLATAKPCVLGPQTAKVVGSGEIDCDEHGRIKVRFHWDRKSNQSRLVRVAQVFAGQKWGAVFTPRVGMEVLVEFLEGDPDQPIVVGCVYNGENKPPYDLPGEKNISGWKSDSVGGGGYNEFVMDDSGGSELVRFHAQKDLDSTILNDEKRLVKHDRETTIKNNETLDVTNEILIKAGMKITIECGQSSIVMDPMSIKITSPTVEIKTSLQFSSKSDLLSKHEAGVDMNITGLLVRIN